jgi:predicted TIM-barrel fold metal-dependent hydrolase
VGPAPTAKLTLLLSALAVLVGLSSACRSDPPAPASELATAPSATTAGNRPPLIDVHTHIGGNAYELALELAGQNGVERIVNLSGENQTVGLGPHLAAMQRHPGRIAVFYNLAWKYAGEPDFGPVMAQGLEQAVNAGYAGLKISKVLGLGLEDQDGKMVAVDDPRFDPIWAKAGALGIPVSIHTGDPKAFFEPATPDNERYEELSEAPSWSFADPKYPRREVLLAQRDRVIEKHRGTTFILVHFGGNPEDLDYVDKLLDRHPNVVVDVSARLAEIGRHDPEKVRAFFVKHKDRILFGTDLGIHQRTRDGVVESSFFLGSLSKEPPKKSDVKLFFDRHTRFFESDPAVTGAIDHPVPIQGNWKVPPIHLPLDVLKAVYHDNAYRLIFEPMLRRAGKADPLKSPPSNGP